MPEDNKLSAPSFGARSVGITFNPSGDSRVHEIKTQCAGMIEMLHAERSRETTSAERAAIIDEAIRQIQSAQMWAVKAVTYAY